MPAAVCGRCAVPELRDGGGVESSGIATSLAQGVDGLSVAFDLPTQWATTRIVWRRARSARRAGHRLHEDMPRSLRRFLCRVSTSMTINSTAVILLALYVAVAPSERASGEAIGHGSKRS